MKTYSRRPSNSGRQKNSTPALLILRFDTKQLEQDGLLLADETHFVSTANQLCGARATLLNTTDTADLLRQLGALAQAGAKFDVVVAVGHSNDRGIQIASDRFSSWMDLSMFLRPFAPRRLVLIACKAGSQPAATLLFRRLPSLRRIYASSTNVSRDLATFMLGFLLYLTPTKTPARDVILTAQAASLGLTGIHVREWRRGFGGEIQGTQFDRLVETASCFLKKTYI